MGKKPIKKKCDNAKKVIKCCVTYYNSNTKVVGCEDLDTGKTYQLIVDNYDNSGYINIPVR